MVKRTRKSHKGQSTHTSERHRSGGSRTLQELVVVSVSDTMDEAKDNETLLKNNDIPAMVRKQQDEFSEGIRYAVMVPEDMADEAHVIIESQDSYDDFYDSEMDDISEDDLEGDVFED